VNRESEKENAAHADRAKTRGGEDQTMQRPYNRKPAAAIQLEDLDDEQLADALDLLRFLRRQPNVKWFVDGSKSAAALVNLGRAGIAEVVFDDHDVIAVQRLVSLRGRPA
jgi:hypothetical protein